MTPATGPGERAEPRERTIVISALARVEGEGALTVRLRDGRVDDVRLRIFEAPRFFEAFLRGRTIPRCPTSPRGSAASVPWRTR